MSAKFSREKYLRFKYFHYLCAVNQVQESMKSLEEILDRNRPIDSIISDLKEKSTNPPSWVSLKKILKPKFHDIIKDHQGRQDKVRPGGKVDKAARLAIGLEWLLCKRINQFAFTLPVKRVYSNLDNNETRQAIANAIERIYEKAHINSMNIKRGFAYFASCEIFTLWYVVKKQNNDYGFPSEYKLRCRTFSPLNDDVELYPLLDEYDDMIAFSVAYREKVMDEYVDFFETWTADTHYKWSMKNGHGWADDIVYEDGDGNVTYGDDILIMKIPGSYACKEEPTWAEETPRLRKDVEYSHSRDSDVVAYNAAPILKVAGGIKGQENKGEVRRVYRVESGGDVSYVAWNQSQEATRNHIDRSLDLFWQLNQMPDTSFKNMMALGNIGYDARMTVLMDALLRTGEEAQPLIEFFERECNVIKAFLKQMNRAWAKEIDNVVVTHHIQPYVLKNDEAEINLRLKANGGKAIESQLESIERYGKSKDAQATLDQIQKEDAQEKTTQMNSVFNEGAI